MKGESPPLDVTERDMMQRIRDATERMMAGRPKQVPAGRLSVLALAKEAGVGRATLYREPYDELRRIFEQRVGLARRGSEPEHPVLQLEKRLAEARERIVELTQALRRQERLAQGLARELAWVRNEWKDAERRIENAGSPPESGVIPLRGRNRKPLKP